MDSTDPTTPSRRSLLLGATALTAVAGALPDDAWAATPPRTRIGTLSTLEIGAPQMVEYPAGHPVMLVRLGREARGGVGPDADVVCFSTTCTHQGCPVVFRQGRMMCPCHYSQFDPALGGQCYQGPANDPLPRVRLELDGDAIVATGIDGLVWGHVETPS